MGAGDALAQSAHCNYWITSLPYTVTSARPGTHCLWTDLNWTSTSGAAIILNNGAQVTLDLYGHRLSGVTSPDTVGIACPECSRATIRNGTIGGFGTGVWIGPGGYFGAADVLIEDLTVVVPQLYGTKVTGNGVVVRNNRILNAGNYAWDAFVYGIWVSGKENRILGNDVAATIAGGTYGYGWGIYAWNARRSMISGNRISVQPPVVGSPAFGSIGIDIEGSAANGSDVLVSDNQIIGTTNGIWFGSVLTGKYRDNLTVGVTTPYVGGTNAGNNN